MTTNSADHPSDPHGRWGGAKGAPRRETVLSILSRREIRGTINPGRSYRPSSFPSTAPGGRFVPETTLAARAAWNVRRMNDMILAVGPGTPASVVMGAGRSGSGGGGESDEDEDDDEEERHPLLSSSEPSSSSDEEEQEEDDDDEGDEGVRHDDDESAVMDDGEDDHDSSTVPSVSMSSSGGCRSGATSTEGGATASGRGACPAVPRRPRCHSVGTASTTASGGAIGDDDDEDEDGQTGHGHRHRHHHHHDPHFRLYGQMPQPKPSMRHGGCINTAAWLTAGWRLSLTPVLGATSGSTSHCSNNGVVREFFRPRPVRSEECPTQLLTSGDDRTVKFWDVSGAMGSCSPSPHCSAGGTLPFCSSSYGGGGGVVSSPSPSPSPSVVRRWRRSYHHRGGGKGLHGTVLPLATVHTGHRGNVFCATPVPYQPGKVVTCAADGYLNLSDVEQQATVSGGGGGRGRRGSNNNNDGRAQSTVIVSPEFQEEGNQNIPVGLLLLRSAMCFSHHFLSSNTGLLCSERGLHRFDLRLSPREQSTRSILSDWSTSSSSGGGGSSSTRPQPCKAAAIWRPHGTPNYDAANPFELHESDEDLMYLDDATYIFAGGGSGEVGLYDLRMDRPSRIMRRYRPSGMSSPEVVNTISVSGLDVSRDGRELLVSYENDQIYSFDICSPRRHTHGPGDPDVVEGQGDNDAMIGGGVHYRNGLTSSAGAAPTSRRFDDDDEPVTERASYGGHLNRFTFLKGARYAGPRDEYICTGSDSGHAWIYDRSTGAVVSLLKADRSTCNGVIPHPTQPMFVTYGIDSTAKLWRATIPVNKEADDSFRGRAGSYLRGDEYRKSALVRKWKTVQNKINLLGEVVAASSDADDDEGGGRGNGNNDKTDTGILPDEVPSRGGEGGGMYDETTSFSVGSHWLQYRRSVDPTPRHQVSDDPVPRGIGNNLRYLPELLQQNYYACVRAAANGEDDPVKSGLVALARRVAVARSGHQADRVGLRWDPGVAPWMMDFRTYDCTAKAKNDAAAAGGMDSMRNQDLCDESLRHPADLVPDFPSDWMPYDCEMTPRPREFGLACNVHQFSDLRGTTVEPDTEEEGRESNDTNNKKWVVPLPKDVDEGPRSPPTPTTTADESTLGKSGTPRVVVTPDRQKNVVAPRSADDKDRQTHVSEVAPPSHHDAVAMEEDQSSSSSYSDQRAWSILLETVQVLKAGGNHALRCGAISLAARRYDRAIRYCALAFLTFPVGNLRFLSSHQAELANNAGYQVRWTTLFKTFITIRLNLSMTMLKPQLADYNGAMEQARLSIHELKPFVSTRGKVMRGQEVYNENEPESTYRDAKLLIAKAYFRLGTAQYHSKEFANAVQSFERSIQSTKDADPGGGGKPEPIVLRRLAEAKRENLKKKQRHRKKFKSMFAATAADEKGTREKKPDDDEKDQQASRVGT